MKPCLDYCEKCEHFYRQPKEFGDAGYMYFSCHLIRNGSLHGMKRLSDGVVISRDMFQVPENCPYSLEHIMKNENEA